MWYNESIKFVVAAVLEHPATDARSEPYMDNTVPQFAPQHNRKKVYYDGRKGKSVESHDETTEVVYGLVDPRDNKIFYIGITNNLYLRFKQHMLMTGDNERKQARIQAILGAHMLPWMLTLEVVDVNVSAREREIAYIQAYVDAGYELLNSEVQ